MDSSSQSNRFMDPEVVLPGFMNPIQGLKNCPDLAFLDCFSHASRVDSTIPDFSAFTSIAHFYASTPGFCENSHNLSESQVASLHLYTQESPFYSFINKLLRERDRERLKPLFPLLKIMLSALRSLPCEKRTVYRGVKRDLSSKFQKGKKFVWWSITSTTSSVDTLQQETFLGAKGERTLFAIEAKSAVLVTEYAALGDGEEEWLLPPGTFLEVTAILDLGSNLHMIQLKEIEGPPLIDLPSSLSKSEIVGEFVCGPDSGSFQGVINWLGSVNGKYSKARVDEVIKTKCYPRLDEELEGMGVEQWIGKLRRYCYTEDKEGSWFSVDLGEYCVCPKKYSLRHGMGWGKYAVRNWTLQGSLDEKKWVDISVHVKDETISQSFGVGTWEVNRGGKRAFRYFRILETGVNSSGNFVLALSGFELFGTLQKRKE